MMQLLQSRALPLGYPATGTGKLILFLGGIKLSFARHLKFRGCFGHNSAIFFSQRIKPGKKNNKGET
jgi:hypothetical protein